MTILADTRYALRQLRKSPGFAITAVLTLALGIGATTSIFTLVYQVLLRSLPVAHPEQLYKLGKDNNSGVSGGLQSNWSLFSYDCYKYLRDQTPDTAGIAAVESGLTTVSLHRSGEAASQPLTAHFVSGNYFSVLGVKPYAGRLLTPEDDREGAPPAAVVSYTLWRTKFASDPHLVGSTLLLTGHPVTIVGIGAESFLSERQIEDPPGLWIPLAQEPVFEPAYPLMRYPGSGWLDLLVRIPDRSHLRQVEQALRGELKQWILSNRGLFEDSQTDRLNRQTTELVPASGVSDIRDQYESSLKLLMLVAGFVLLIACANLANLMLVRGMSRQQELAVRSALGAPRARLIRQMLVEAVLLALFGGVAAIAVAYVGTRGILALAIRGVELSPLSAAPSLPVLGFALLVSLVTGVIFGIVPAWISSRSNPVEALRGANRSTRDASALPQKLLVIGQAALSLALLSTSGLLITSLRHLERQNFHFETHGRLIVFTNLEAAGYTLDRLPALYQKLNDDLSQTPGVESVAYATYGPMANDYWRGGVFQIGLPPVFDSSRLANYSAVSQHYFATLGTHVLQGRDVSEHDSATSTHVAVVNQAFVQHFLKGKDAIGAHFGPSPMAAGEFEIVGVVEDTKYRNPNEPTEPMYFTPITQSVAYTLAASAANEAQKHFATNLIVRYHGDASTAAAAVRQGLSQIDPKIPVLKMLTYEDQLSSNFTEEELVVRLTSLFGLLALLLASIGLYGVTAYAVARRTSEMGIRMALGASRSGVLGMIVRTAVAQALLGLVIGLPLTFAAGRLVQHSLYETSAFQPAVLLAVAALLIASALAAALIPARRAASIEPMIALRSE